MNFRHFFTLLYTYIFDIRFDYFLTVGTLLTKHNNLKNKKVRCNVFI